MNCLNKAFVMSTTAYVFVMKEENYHIFFVEKKKKNKKKTLRAMLYHQNECLFVLRFYGPVNPSGSCQAQFTQPHLLLGRFSPLGG